jgi:hypothetical protein
MTANVILRTSEPDWIVGLAKAYRQQRSGVLIDDAGIGIDPVNQTLFEMARQANLSPRELAGVCVALGMSAVGIGMILLAFFDPEPTSKLAFLAVGGTVCILGGGFTAVRILTHHRPPNIKVGKGTFEFSWD